jgi:tripartite-type tricarboxylate transporter receptor subunit TctC
MKLNVLKRPLLMATVAAALLSTGVVRAADFAGATINLIVPFRAGGGTDEWARFYASRIAEQLPGKPEIVVKNVPGAGSTTGANQFQRLARPDGLTLIATSGSTHLAAILDDPRVQYNVSNWIPIVASPSGAVSIIRTDLGLKTPADVAKSKTHLKIASQQATSLDLVALLAYDLLGWDVEAIFGYKGRSDGRVAFEKNEANLDYQTAAAYLDSVKPLIESGVATPMFSLGSLGANGTIERDPTFPQVPTVIDAYQAINGKAPAGPAFEAYKALFIATYGVQKLIFLPQGTPADLVDAYQKAVAAVLADPNFSAQAGKEIGDYKQIQGPALADAMKGFTTIKPETKEWVQKWLKEKYNVAPGAEFN